MKKIIVVEPNMKGAPHSEINAGFLSILEDVHTNKELLFLSEEQHYQSVIKKKSLIKWKYKKIKNREYSPKNALTNELVLMYRVFRYLFFEKNVEKIYLLGILPLAHCFLSLLNRVVRKDIIIALHGQMEAYLPNTKIGKTRHYYRLSIKIFKRKDYLRYIVFGESIWENIKFLFAGKNKVLLIDQPYILEGKALKIKQFSGECPLVIGVIGRADNGKNIKEFFYLVSLLRKEVEQGSVKIKIIGKLFVEIPQDVRGYFSYSTEKLDDAMYEKEIESLHYALSFTNTSFYRATPSGVLFDCIKMHIPVLGLDNDFLRYYFHNYGNFGKLFQTIEQMSDYIKLIVKSKEAEDYRATFYKLRENLSLEVQKLKFERQL